ncbi:MAG: sugar phosphate nucleotidyltransferase [Chthoniobacterales bacterium]
MSSAAIRKAFVLGAGLGKRLRPLTTSLPKPLIPIYQKPLITFAFDHLIASGITDLMVNTHHCAEAYGALFPHSEGTFSYRGATVTLRNEPVLLETGGGIKNIEDWVQEEPFLVYNGDILTDVSIQDLIFHHREGGNAATLLLRSKGGPLHVQWDSETGEVVDIGRKIGANYEGTGFLFSGVYILEPMIFSRLKAGEITSIIPIFLEMIRRGGKVGGFLQDEGMWFDLGTREAYLEVHRELARRNFQFSYSVPQPWPVRIAESAKVANDISLEGVVVIGEGSHVAAGAKLQDTIVWENAEIASGSALNGCIVTSGQSVEGYFTEKDFG